MIEIRIECIMQQQTLPYPCLTQQNLFYIYSECEEAVQTMLDSILPTSTSTDAIGLDCEWRSNYFPAKTKDGEAKKHKVALLQVAYACKGVAHILVRTNMRE